MTTFAELANEVFFFSRIEINLEHRSSISLRNISSKGLQCELSNVIFPTGLYSVLMAVSSVIVLSPHLKS